MQLRQGGNCPFILGAMWFGVPVWNTGLPLDSVWLAKCLCLLLSALLSFFCVVKVTHFTFYEKLTETCSG